MKMTTTKGVKTTHPDYDRLSPKWKRCSDVVDGQDAIHARTTAYLPKLKDEDDESYKARLKRSDFFNATWRTIAGLSGMAFRKPPVVKVPAGIEPFLADIDMAGCSLDDMAKHLLEDALEYGPFGLMVDYPPAPENVTALTVATAELMGLRPLVQYYRIESVINWRYTRINNQQMLSLVVIKEAASVAEDEFSHKTEPRYRVLDLDEAGHYRQRVFKVEDGKDILVEGPIYPLMNSKPLDYIPFRIVGEIDEPPLIDLVDKNIAHYQLNADYRHGLHYTALPTLFLSGMQPAEDGSKFYIGSGAAILSPDPNARGMFIEFTGQGLGAIEAALDRLEKQMAILGARMIADETRQVETLGATQIKRSGENSILSDLVIGVSDAIEWALGIFAQWAGQAGEVSYEINREFTPTMMDAQTLTALVGAVQAGQISEREFFELMQRGDVIDSTKPFDEHQAEVEIAAPPMPKPKEEAA